jgi:hypothetical protein
VDGRGVKIWAITNYAQSSGRMANFREIYQRLSMYAHPSSAAHFASMRVGEDRTLPWQSAPRSKRDVERLIAYAWCVEFARAITMFSFGFATPGARAATRRHKMWSHTSSQALHMVSTQLVRHAIQACRGKREPGVSPGLPRSGEWERQPSHSTGPTGLGSDGQ